MLGRSGVWILLAALGPWVWLASDAGGRPDPTKLTPLEAWRKPDSRGRACASCHSPDGIEVAAYNFSDEDILRRALGHLSPDDAPLAVQMVHDVRTRYGIKTLLDPMQDRPMQPGGSVLPGNTPMERDAAFAATLPALLPKFFGSPIRSLAEAQSARDDLLALDLTKLKVGIPMNRLSEDVFHGKEHSTIADWLADVPVATPIPMAMQDAYLANPTEQAYEALDEELARQEQTQSSPAQICSLNKRRSVLYFAQDLRAKFSGVEPPKLPAGVNPMWNLGEFGRQFQYAPIQTLGLPADISEKKQAGPTSVEQMTQLRLAWYWLGWVADPGLQRSGESLETKRADYFTRFLWSDGPYPVHTAFMLTRKIASESFVRAAWNSRTPQHMDLNYSGMTNDSGYFGRTPNSGEHRRLLQEFLANAYRMNLLLLQDELSHTKTVYLRLALLQQIKRMRKLLTDPSDLELTKQVEATIAECKDSQLDARGGRAIG